MICRRCCFSVRSVTCCLNCFRANAKSLALVAAAAATCLVVVQHFQATSSYLGNFGDVRDRFLPLTVQRTKRSEVKLVRLLGVGQRCDNARKDSFVPA